MSRLILILGVFLLPSCYGVKHGGTKGVAKILEEYFVGDGKMQYFVKPLHFTGKSESLVADFTFRDSVGVKSKVKLNFSILSGAKILKVDSIAVMSSDGQYQFSTTAPSLMFNEMTGKGVVSRFSSTIEYAAFSSILTQEAQIVVFINGKQVFTPTSRTKKKSRKLARSLA